MNGLVTVKLILRIAVASNGTSGYPATASSKSTSEFRMNSVLQEVGI